MKRKFLGISGLLVSRLCFGTLPFSPFQKNFSPGEAGDLLCQAYEMGVNFFDAAEIYETYDALAVLIRKYPEAIIASRSYAVTAEEMRGSLELARRKLNRDYVDIFGLHEVENDAALRGHQGALDFLVDAKAKGLIRAVGISTHTIAGARAGATDPRIDVIHPLLNRDGIGIRDGSTGEMVAALDTAKDFGKGVYAMKVLAGGHLAGEAEAALHFVTGLSCVDAVAVGMQSGDEVRWNVDLLNGVSPSSELQKKVAGLPRSMQLVTAWCQGCGQCVETCGSGAVVLETVLHGEQKARIIPEKCVRCGYCARVCPEFCLKII